MHTRKAGGTDGRTRGAGNTLGCPINMHDAHGQDRVRRVAGDEVLGPPHTCPASELHQVTPKIRVSSTKRKAGEGSKY